MPTRAAVGRVLPDSLCSVQRIIRDQHPRRRRTGIGIAEGAADHRTDGRSWWIGRIFIDRRYRAPSYRGTIVDCVDRDGHRVGIGQTQVSGQRRHLSGAQRPVIDSGIVNGPVKIECRVSVPVLPDEAIGVQRIVNGCRDRRCANRRAIQIHRAQISTVAEAECDVTPTCAGHDRAGPDFLPAASVIDKSDKVLGRIIDSKADAVTERDH